jgi:hypothetical protein
MPYSLGKPKHSRHWTQSPGMMILVVNQLMIINDGDVYYDCD